MYLKKGQSAIEFLILVGAVLFFFSAFLFSIQLSNADKNREKHTLEVKEVAQIVQDEVNIALGASDGYSRNFSIPQMVAGRDYEISFVADSVYVRTDDGLYATSYSVGEVIGEIKKGSNIIRNVNGSIYVNCCDFKITSADFVSGGTIPIEFACNASEGQNKNPQLEWTGSPPGTESFVLIFENSTSRVHWIVWDIPNDVDEISSDVNGGGEDPAFDCVVGKNDEVPVERRYYGPCLPAGETDTYFFRLYALDIDSIGVSGITVGPGEPRESVENAMAGHILYEASLRGTFTG